MNKKDYIITADSGCCPGNNILTNNNDVPIKEIPAIINDTNGNEYKDGIDITPIEVINRSKNGEIFKTSSPSTMDYIDTFTSSLEEGKTVFHVSMGEHVSSASLNNAIQQATVLNEKYGERIFVIDSKAGAVAGKLIITIIESLINKGYSNTQIYNLITNDYIPRIATSFVVPDVSGFIRSGRNKTKKSNLVTMKNTLIKATGKAMTMLKLQTQVDFKNGELHATKCFRGSDKLALLNLLKNNISLIKEADETFFVYGTILSNDEAMAKARQYIDSLDYFKLPIRQDISSVIAAYGDPNLCGISYVKKHSK